MLRCQTILLTLNCRWQFSGRGLDWLDTPRTRFSVTITAYRQTASITVDDLTAITVNNSLGLLQIS